MKYKVGDIYKNWESLTPFGVGTILKKGALAVVVAIGHDELPLGTVVQIDESDSLAPFLLPRYPDGGRTIRSTHKLAPLPQVYEVGDIYKNWEKLEPLPEDKIVEGEVGDLFALVKSYSDTEAGRILLLGETGSSCPYMTGWEDEERRFVPNGFYLAPLPKEEIDFTKEFIYGGAITITDKDTNQNTKTFINSKPQNTMNSEGKTLSEQYLSALIEEPQKTFIDLGITHQNGDLTGDGQVLFLNYLFKSNIEEFNETVVQVIKDSQKKQD